MIRIICSALLLLGTLAAPALAGPSWISIEVPANPHHASTRGAALLVRAYRHSTSVAMPVHGTAEGIVDGKRTSLPLEIHATKLTGVYAVRSALPKGGTWVLALKLTEGPGEIAGAIVTLDTKGGIRAVDVPSTRSRDGWTVPRAISERDITEALRSARIANAADEGAPRAALASMIGVPLLLLGLARLGRATSRP